MHPKLPFLWKSRNDLPHLLNDMGLIGTGVEVGTQRGFFAEHLRRHWVGERLVCVDPWRPYPGIEMTAEDHEACYQEALGRLSRTGKGFQLERSTSAEAAHRWQGYKLDFVYIDADHDYAPVKADIAAWWPLVKSGGIIAGHDYVVDGWHVHGEPFNSHSYNDAYLSGKPCSPFFVRKAVAEAFPNENIALTSREEDGGWQSWLVVRP